MATGIQNQNETLHNLRTQLALAVRSIQWSYAIFWSVSSRQSGMLEWCEGYYNGDIKTRKTVQAAEVNMDQLGLQRSDQLRELYESLKLGETVPQARRPTAALSPEDLTDAEWYFLVCMSFVFNTNQGLAGRTLAKNQMIWLCNAHRADTKVFSRSLLAKSASIKTILCFPHSGGVVELGTTELVQEDPNLILHISSFLESPSVTIPTNHNHAFDSSACHNNLSCEMPDHANMAGDGLDQLLGDPYMEMCSPNKSSDDFACNLLREEPNLVEGVDIEASQMQSWPIMDDAVSNCLNNSMNSSDCVSETDGEPETIIPLSDGKKKTKRCNQKKTSDFPGNDAHYHSVLSNLLRSSHQLILGPYIRNGTNRESSFLCWRKDGIRVPQRGTPQKLLKKVLFEVPTMHQSCKAESSKHNSSSKREVDVIDKNHVLSERKRREKINERFMILGSLVPSGGKVDKVSVLDNTIQYLRELERRVEVLETYKEAMERESTTHSKSQEAVERTSDNYGTGNSKKAATNKRKACHIEETGAESSKVQLRDSTTDNIAVSVSDKDILIEIRCSWNENVLLQVMETLSKIRVETQTVQSFTSDGTFTITVNAKCKGLKSPSAVVIRQAIQKVIMKC